MTVRWRSVRLYLLTWALGGLMCLVALTRYGSPIGSVVMELGARIAACGSAPIILQPEAEASVRPTKGRK